MHPWTVVELNGDDRTGQRHRVSSVVEVVPDVDELTHVRRGRPAEQVRDGAGPGQHRPREALDGEQQIPLGQPAGQRIEPGRGRIEVEWPTRLGRSAELAGADVAATERVGHRLDPVHQRVQLGRIGIRPGPSAQELDLHHAKPGPGQHGLHPGHVQARRHGPRQVVDVQPDPGEAGVGRRLATRGERVARRLPEAGPGQREEAGDQLVPAAGGPGEVSHGRPRPRPGTGRSPPAGRNRWPRWRSGRAGGRRTARPRPD